MIMNTIYIIICYSFCAWTGKERCWRKNDLYTIHVWSVFGIRLWKEFRTCRTLRFRTDLMQKWSDPAFVLFPEEANLSALICNNRNAGVFFYLTQHNRHVLYEIQEFWYRFRKIPGISTYLLFLRLTEYAADLCWYGCKSVLLFLEADRTVRSSETDSGFGWYGLQDPRIYPDTHIEISGFRRAGGILIKGRNHLFQWDKIDSMHPVTDAGRFSGSWFCNSSENPSGVCWGSAGYLLNGCSSNVSGHSEWQRRNLTVAEVLCHGIRKSPALTYMVPSCCSAFSVFQIFNPKNIIGSERICETEASPVNFSKAWCLAAGKECPFFNASWSIWL